MLHARSLQRNLEALPYDQFVSRMSNLQKFLQNSPTEFSRLIDSDGRNYVELLTLIKSTQGPNDYNASHVLKYNAILENLLKMSSLDGTPILAKAILFNELTAQAMIDISTEQQLNQTDPYTRWNPLFWAVLANKPSILQSLLERNVNVDQHDKDDITPIMFASLKGHRECVSTLLTKNPNLTIVNKVGYTALGYANRNGYPEIEKILREAAMPRMSLS